MTVEKTPELSLGMENMAGIQTGDEDVDELINSLPAVPTDPSADPSAIISALAETHDALVARLTTTAEPPRS